MMRYGWNDGGWGIFWGILSMSVIVTLVWVVLRAFVADGSRGDRRTPTHGAKDVLAERFAKGEIDAEEYRERLHTLEETGARKAG